MNLKSALAANRAGKTAIIDSPVRESRVSCEGLGSQSLLAHFGRDAFVRVQVDAAAAKTIVERKGLSKVRHLEAAALWIQEQQVRRLLPLDSGHQE